MISSSRRRLLGAVLAAPAVALLPTGARAHGQLGAVEPAIAIPALPCVTSDGRSGTLLDLLKGRTTAVQLMFTGCSAICPMQGALYASVQERLRKQAQRDIQLLSLSIDPLSDRPEALAAWLKQFGADERWIAAAPAIAKLDETTALFKGPSALPDNHSGQIYLIRRDAKLVWRTQDLPTARDVVDLLVALAQLA